VVTAPWEGKPLKGGTPRGGCGMKQARKVSGGVNRRGGVKPRGRNASGWSTGRTWTLGADVAIGERTSWEGPGPRGHPAGRARQYPVGERNFTRGSSRGRKLRGRVVEGTRQGRERSGQYPGRINDEDGALNQYGATSATRKILCRGTQLHEGMMVAGDRGCPLVQTSSSEEGRPSFRTA